MPLVGMEQVVDGLAPAPGDATAVQTPNPGDRLTGLIVDVDLGQRPPRGLFQQSSGAENLIARSQPHVRWHRGRVSCGSPRETDDD